MTEMIESGQSGSKSVVSSEKRLNSVHCLVIPVFAETLLLPNAAVAEVIGFIEPEPIADSPPWLLGRILWRERAVPLISFEAASGKSLPDMQNANRVAILNTLNSSSKVPYIGIVLQGIPSLRQIKQDTFTNNSVVSNRVSVAAELPLDSGQVVIPDIDDLESRLEQLT